MDAIKDVIQKYGVESILYYIKCNYEDAFDDFNELMDEVYFVQCHK